MKRAWRDTFSILLHRHITNICINRHTYTNALLIFIKQQCIYICVYFLTMYRSVRIDLPSFAPYQEEKRPMPRRPLPTVLLRSSTFLIRLLVRSFGFQFTRCSVSQCQLLLGILRRKLLCMWLFFFFFLNKLDKKKKTTNNNIFINKKKQSK